MKFPRFVWLALGLLALTCRAASTPSIVPSGENTFTVTVKAATGFVRDTDKLKAEALAAAEDHCRKLGKQLKVISATASKPRVMFTDYAHAQVVFKALDASDPELHAPVESAGTAAPPVARSATDALYNDLLKLDELRKRGILTEDEFQAQKKKLLEK